MNFPMISKRHSVGCTRARRCICCLCNRARRESLQSKLFALIGIQVVMDEVNEMMVFSMFDCGGVCKVIKYYYMTMLLKYRKMSGDEEVKMKIYDISQEVFGCDVYSGDPAPQKKIICSMADGDLYNLSEFSMCAHNGTHVDAPYHFYQDGKTIDAIYLENFIGAAYVAEYQGMIMAEDAIAILEKARKTDRRSMKRILIKGEAVVSVEAAEVFAEAGILLIGNESQTVGPEDAPMEVHLKLLGAGVVLLEGIRLGEVAEGVHFLNAAPINLGGAEGAPCRAVLIEMEE